MGRVFKLVTVKRHLARSKARGFCVRFRNAWQEVSEDLSAASAHSSDVLRTADPVMASKSADSPLVMMTTEERRVAGYAGTGLIHPDPYRT
jgi:hypothetical protein